MKKADALAALDRLAQVHEMVVVDDFADQLGWDQAWRLHKARREWAHLTPEERAGSLRDLADRFEVSHQTIRRWLKDGVSQVQSSGARRAT